MKKVNVVFCPDCEIFYMPEINEKTGKESYVYVDSDTASETHAKKINDEILQCPDCGAVFLIDENTAFNSKPVLVRPHFGLVRDFNKKMFYDEFVSAYNVSPTEKQLNSYISYMMGKSIDVSNFIDVVLKSKGLLKEQSEPANN